MKHHVVRQVKVLRSTLIGGVIFLLPVLVIGFLIGQAAPYFLAVVTTVNEWLPGQSAWTYTVVFIAALLLILLVCFVAGIAARWSLSRAVATKFEKNLTLLFPRYAIFKDQLAGNLGGEYAEGRLTPVLVPDVGGRRVGFEIERDERRVTVYLPGSPDPWTGHVVIATPENVTPFNAPTQDLLSTFEKLGRDILPLLPQENETKPHPEN